jgi:hypothetical protein
LNFFSIYSRYFAYFAYFAYSGRNSGIKEWELQERARMGQEML